MQSRKIDLDNYQQFYYLTVKDKFKLNQLKLKGDAKTLEMVNQRLGQFPGLKHSV